MNPKNQKKTTKTTASKKGKAAKLKFARERTQFTSLLMANPNYFGNLTESAYTPVVEIKSNTYFEEIGCVGFHPQTDRLEAVVFVNQPNGYGGNICSKGTPEYVRFYLSCNNGDTWEDVGIASFRAYNIPEGTVGRKRLEYAVSLDIDDKTKEKFCFIENICYVRAILSWNFPPPPNTPDFVPVWGNVHNTHIQIDALKFFLVD